MASSIRPFKSLRFFLGYLKTLVFSTLINTKEMLLKKITFYYKEIRNNVEELSKRCPLEAHIFVGRACRKILYKNLSRYFDVSSLRILYTLYVVKLLQLLTNITILASHFELEQRLSLYF